MYMAADPSVFGGSGRENVRVKAAPGPGPDIGPEFGPESGAHAGSTLASDAERRVARMVTMARLLDGAFVIPGIGVRVGWDAILGLATGVGDVAGALASLYLVHEARKLGAPRNVLAMMLTNVAIDCAIGVVPGLGDVVDAVFKANVRNLKLIGVTMHEHGHTWSRPSWVRPD